MSGAEDRSFLVYWRIKEEGVSAPDKPEVSIKKIGSNGTLAWSSEGKSEIKICETEGRVE